MKHVYILRRLQHTYSITFMKTIIPIDAVVETLKAKFEKVFQIRVPNENAVYQSNEEVEREYFKTGGIFYVKY